MRECPDLTLATVGPLLEQASEGCDAAGDVVEKLRDGAGIDTVGPAAAEALRACQCRLASTRGFAAMLAFITIPWPEAAWVPLPDELPAAGTVADWLATHKD